MQQTTIHLKTKWSDYLSGIRYKNEVAQLLENQSRYFEAVAKQQPLTTEEKAFLGPLWLPKVMRALARGADACPLMDLVSVQPLVAPVGVVSYYVRPNLTPLQEFTELVFDGYRLERHTTEVQASPRKVRARFTTDLWERQTPLQEFTEEVFADEAPSTKQRMLDILFEEMFLEITREVIGLLLSASISGPLLKCSTQQLGASIMTAIEIIYAKTRRSPGNRVVTNPALAFLIEESHPNLKTWVDPSFPSNRVLVLRKGEETEDAHFIWSPYVFTVNRTAPSIYLNSTAHRYGLVYRSSNKLVIEDGSVAIEVT